MQVSKQKFIETIIKIIKTYRKNTGKSIYQISAECSMPNSTWRKFENGNYNDIKFTTLWKILEGLEIEPENFIKTLKTDLGKDFTLID